MFCQRNNVPALVAAPASAYAHILCCHSSLPYLISCYHHKSCCFCIFTLLKPCVSKFCYRYFSYAGCSAEYCCQIHFFKLEIAFAIGSNRKISTRPAE